MRHLYITLLTALMGGIAAQAQTADYQPLVREGVRWINHSHLSATNYGGDNTYYAIEFHGDTSIVTDDVPHSYKKCYRYNIDLTQPRTTISIEGEKPVAFVREEDNNVYVIDANWIDTEYKLYSYQPGKVLFYNRYLDTQEPGWCEEYNYKNTVEINGNACRSYEGDFGLFIESVGLVSEEMGDLLWPKWTLVPGDDYFYGLEQLEDLHGKILYKAQPETDYQPLVREGRTWVYKYTYDYDDNPYAFFYTLKFEGDTVINKQLYKKCFREAIDAMKIDTFFEQHAERYDYSSFFHSDSEPVAFVREDNGKVYAIFNHHRLCIGWQEVLDHLGLLNYNNETGEFEVSQSEAMIYNFDQIEQKYEKSGIILDGVTCNEYWKMIYGNHRLVQFTESVGRVNGGDLIIPNWIVYTGDYDTSSLCYVMDEANRIIYVNPDYTEIKYDVNGDGKVDVADVNIVINGILNETYDLNAADVTGDEKIDIADVNAIIDAMLTK